MLKCVIFDLDGVIVSTDEQHYLGWKYIADELGIYFDREINHRQRGVSRMESLDVLLEKSTISYTDEQKQALAEKKNDYYKELIKKLSPSDILCGVNEFLKGLKEHGIKVAIGSSSRNTMTILKAIGLIDAFDFIADGTMIERSKPFPDVFLLAAKGAGIDEAECLVIEDADAGVQAGVNAGMKVYAVGSAKDNSLASFSSENLNNLDLDKLIKEFNK